MAAIPASSIVGVEDQYAKSKVSDANLKALREKRDAAIIRRNIAQQQVEALKATRESLLKADGRELRAPEDLAELRGDQKMKFNETLNLQIGGGYAVKMDKDCIFKVTPLSSEDERNWTYIVKSGSSWKFAYMNPELQEIKDEKHCSDKMKVHPSRTVDCMYDIRSKGNFLLQPSVILQDENKKFLQVENSVDGKGSKEILACLTARGFSPEKILAKIKPAAPAPAPADDGADPVAIHPAAKMTTTTSN